MHRLFIFILLLTAIPASGCASLASVPSRLTQRVTDFVQCVDENWKTIHEIKDARQQALKEELKADREATLGCELAELSAERDSVRAEQQYRTEALRAETERRREELNKSFDESVRTKLGLNLDQRVRMGQLQVDTQKLQALTQERERDYEFRTKLYQDALREEELNQRSALLSNMRREQALMNGQDPDESAAIKGCCTQVEVNDCARPPKSPLKEGPNRSQPLRAPVRQPILSTEVPFMLPVTLEVAMGSGSIGPSEVRRQPLKQACLHPCGKCDSSQKKSGGNCPQPCGRCPACAATISPPAPAAEPDFQDEETQ